MTADAAVATAIEWIVSAWRPDWQPTVEEVQDAGESWRIFYNTQIFIETREVSHPLAGNLPLLVHKITGEVTTDLTFLPPGHPQRP